MTMCPFGAITLVDRPADAPRPAEVKDDGKLAVIDPRGCRACGICAANCPEVAIAHNLADDALFGRIAIMTEGVDATGDRLLLQGVRRRRHQLSAASAATTTPRTCGSSSCRAWGASARCTSWRRPAWAPPACSSPAAPKAAASTARGDTSAPGAAASIAEEVLAEAGTPHPARALAPLRRRPPERGTAHPPVRRRAAGDELSRSRSSARWN